MILVVDPQGHHCDALGAVCDNQFEIDRVPDAGTALVRLCENCFRYAAIFIDGVEERQTDYSFLKQYRSTSWAHMLPVFSIVPEDDHETIVELHRNGTADALMTPFHPVSTGLRISSVIAHFRERMSHQRSARELQWELNAQALQIYDLHRSLVGTMAAAIEFRDGESGEHVKRIHDITAFLLSQTDFGNDFSQKDIDDIALASMMHDVGKIGIPDAILCKPGRLTESELTVMRQHTTIGARILDSIPQLHKTSFFSFARDIALHHHERWDGRGYPEGLKGDEISLPAQIVSLADVYDALIIQRCYKPAYDRKTTVEKIARGECGVFNPELLKQFLEVEDRLHQEIYEASQGTVPAQSPWFTGLSRAINHVS